MLRNSKLLKILPFLSTIKMVLEQNLAVVHEKGIITRKWISALHDICMTSYKIKYMFLFSTFHKNSPVVTPNPYSFKLLPTKKTN